jgi:hypothetical protein
VDPESKNNLHSERGEVFDTLTNKKRLTMAGDARTKEGDLRPFSSVACAAAVVRDGADNNLQGDTGSSSQVSPPTPFWNQERSLNTGVRSRG